MLIPLWEFAPCWWQLACPDTNHFSDNVVDWVWLRRDDPTLFQVGIAPGRAVLPPDYPAMVIRVDFTETKSSPLLIKRERCIRGANPNLAASLGTGSSKVASSG